MDRYRIAIRKPLNSITSWGEEEPVRYLEVCPDGTFERVLSKFYEHQTLFYGEKPPILVLGAKEALSLGFECWRREHRIAPDGHPLEHWNAKPPSTILGMRVVVSGLSGISFAWEGEAPASLLWSLVDAAPAFGKD